MNVEKCCLDCLHKNKSPAQIIDGLILCGWKPKLDKFPYWAKTSWRRGENAFRLDNPMIDCPGWEQKKC